MKPALSAAEGSPFAAPRNDKKSLPPHAGLQRGGFLPRSVPMCAKKNSKPGNGKSAPQLQPATVPAAPAPSASVPAAVSEANVAWIDSTDPRKRLVGKIALVVVWLYVAALMLLALDQTFHWGIFGPKTPPLP